MSSATTQQSAAPVLVEERGRVLVMTVNRPARRNAINYAAAELLAEAVTRLDERDDLAVGVLQGAGDVFSAGMDLKEFGQGTRPHIEGRGFAGLTEAPPRKPLIAAVEGWAMGGGFEMVLAADLVVASTSARFGLPEVRRGLTARGGGAFRLPRRVPRAIAMEMLLTGEPIDARRAERLGLVNRVTEPGGALAEALELATVVAANAPLAVAATKVVVSRSGSWSDTEAFEQQREWFDAVFESADAREGRQAFLERRVPVWQGR